jgi:hypothetical protein
MAASWPSQALAAGDFANGLERSSGREEAVFGVVEGQRRAQQSFATRSKKLEESGKTCGGFSNDR